MLLKCKYCGKNFNSDRSKRKYCSGECGHRDREYNLLGKSFGYLNVIENLGLDGIKGILWLCKCECGNIVKRHTRELTNGQNQSCGCKRKTAYGLIKTAFYYKYNSIHLRCEDKNSDSYKRYGGKGIKCKWENFQDFYKDMYESYITHVKEYGEKNTTIDRIDNNGDYCKENCRWATMKEQSNNRSTNRYIEYGGCRLTMQQWAEKIGITRNSFIGKLSRGVPMEWIVKHPHKRWYSYYNIEEQLKRYI